MTRHSNLTHSRNFCFLSDALLRLGFEQDVVETGSSIPPATLLENEVKANVLKCKKECANTKTCRGFDITNEGCFHYSEPIDGTENQPTGFCYSKNCPPTKFEYTAWSGWKKPCAEQSLAERKKENKEYSDREESCNANPGCSCSAQSKLKKFNVDSSGINLSSVPCCIITCAGVCSSSSPFFFGGGE